MEKFLFADGQGVCEYADGKVKKIRSKLSENYKTAAINVERAKSRKHGGEVKKSGVADYDIFSDGTFVVTNGKHIFAVKDKKSKKRSDTEKCLKVSRLHRSVGKADLFDIE